MTRTERKKVQRELLDTITFYGHEMRANGFSEEAERLFRTAMDLTNKLAHSDTSTDSAVPDSATEDIDAGELTAGRTLIISERIETVTAVDLARAGFVQFFTDDRPEGTNLPYTYRVDDKLTALAKEA